MTAYHYELTFGFCLLECPGCNTNPKVPAKLVTVKGEWIPWHESCYVNREEHE